MGAQWMYLVATAWRRLLWIFVLRVQLPLLLYLLEHRELLGRRALHREQLRLGDRARRQLARERCGDGSFSTRVEAAAHSTVVDDESSTRGDR